MSKVQRSPERLQKFQELSSFSSQENITGFLQMAQSDHENAAMIYELICEMAQSEFAVSDSAALMDALTAVNTQVLAESGFLDDESHDDVPKSFYKIHERLQKHLSHVCISEPSYQNYLQNHLLILSDAVVQNHENFTLVQCTSFFKAWHPLISRFETADTLSEAQSYASLMSRLNQLGTHLIFKLCESEDSFCNEDSLGEQLQSASKSIQEAFRPAIELVVRTGSEYVEKLLGKLKVSQGTQQCLYMLVIRQAFKTSAQRLLVDDYN